MVTSRAGRDRGDRYIVVGTLGEDMVLLADGGKRAIGRPKKKNVKHLVLHAVAPALAAKLAQGETLRDDEIQQALAQAAVTEPQPAGEAAGTGD